MDYVTTALLRDFGDVSPDRFGDLERVSGLAVARLEGLSGDMVRAGVEALASSFGAAGEAVGLVAPGVSGARSMFEMARGFAGEAVDFEAMRVVFGALESAADQFEARDILEEDEPAGPSGFERLRDVCRSFGGFALMNAKALGSYDAVDDVLRGSRVWHSAVVYALNSCPSWHGASREAWHLANVVEHLLEVGRRVMRDHVEVLEVEAVRS